MKTIGIVFVFGIFLVIVYTLSGAILMLAWNYVIPNLFHLMRLTLFQAIAIVAVVSCLLVSIISSIKTKSY